MECFLDKEKDQVMKTKEKLCQKQLFQNLQSCRLLEFQRHKTLCFSPTMNIHSTSVLSHPVFLHCLGQYPLCSRTVRYTVVHGSRSIRVITICR